MSAAAQQGDRRRVYQDDVHWAVIGGGTESEGVEQPLVNMTSQLLGGFT